MMKTVLLIHGPNLNLLGKRDPKHYGSLTLQQLDKKVKAKAKSLGLNMKTFQSNHEGDLIDFIQQNSAKAVAIIINPGALTHYSYALHDALLDTRLPCVEVHLSDVKNREDWRKISVIAPACRAVFAGKNELSYFEALEFLSTTQNAVIGYPLEHTLSPLLHKMVYEELGINAVLLPFPCPPDVGALEKMVEVIRTLPIGLTAVTIPHKQQILKFLDQVDPTAKKIGAVNTVIQKKGKLFGYNTDVVGIAKALEQVSLKGKTVLLLGAGGAARPAAYYVQEQGGKLLCLNRTREHAESLMREFGGKVVDERELHAEDIDVIINATPIGMAPHAQKSPLKTKFLAAHQTVFDIVYNPYETQLLKEARKVGAQTISGLTMFVAQGIEQIRLWQGPKKILKINQEKLLQHLLSQTL